MFCLRILCILKYSCIMQPYSLPCVVRRIGHSATGAPDMPDVGTASGLASLPHPTGNARSVPASAASTFPPGSTLLSRASTAHPQSILFCSVLWPARIAPGPPPPPLVPGLEQSPAEMEASNTMCVTVVGPLSTDSEVRGPAPAHRVGGGTTAQFAQLGFRSSLDWVRFYATIPLQYKKFRLCRACSLQEPCASGS